ncbi:MAG: WD40/YVTN/BNR-like repeat-containing protein [Gemmatimonadales bacterium]
MLLTLSAAFLVQSAAAPMMASVDTSLYGGMRYRLVGPSRGGRVTTVTGVPSQPRTFYMGVASGGVFRTTDGGTTWVPLTDGKVPVGSIGSIAVSESNPSVIYVGTGSDGVRSNVSTGRGVYRSTDGGASWQFAGLYDVGQIGAVRIHPTDPNTLWVAAYGDLFTSSPGRGVFKSTDGGRRWKKTLFISDSTGAMDVELKPGDPSVVYAWMSRIERKPWTIISGSREGGFYRSTDGGETWSRVATGLPGELIGKGNLAVTAADPSRIYALIEAKPGGGLYRSDDGGTTWAQVNAQGSLIQRPFYYTTLGADPTSADVVYAGAEGFFKSTDGGRTMAPLRTPHGDNHDIWVSPRDGNIMVQANDGGANVSFDGGRTWSTQMNQPTSELYGVWVDRAFPYRLYAAQQDNSTLIISSVANPFNREDWRTGPGCETGPIMPHPGDPNIVYGSCKGQYEVMNLALGQSKRYWVGAQSLYGNPARDLILRFQRVSPMATSPHDPSVLYYGSQHVHRTRDKGVTWETISPDLTAKPACCQGVSGEPITRDVTGEEFYSTLYAIVESPHEPGVIWTGANDGPFHITRDNGKTWKNITPKDLPAGGRVAWIEASPHRRGSAYYAVYRYLLGDYRPYLYRTDDYGATWKRLTDGRNGIPVDWPTRVVREDPSREGLLYAGTEFGMFVSLDNGAHWQPFQLNLPNVPINDIRVHRKDLVVATQGRALWIIDDLSPLHQVTPRTLAGEVQLYRPRDGYRTRSGTEYLSPTLRYHLPAGTSGVVKIEILDSAGAPVNSYGSDAPPPARPGRPGGGDPDDPEAPSAGRFATVVSRVTTDAGLNRFVWDLRHSSGVTAPPGRYQARLTVAGVSRTEPFTVLVDPRLAQEGVTVADLREQFQHNLRMRDLVAQVNRAVTRVREAQNRLRNATGPAADTLSRVQAVAGKLLTEPVRYGKPGLQAHITYLNGMTNAVDQKVGRDALARYQVLKRELEAVELELDRTLGADKP